MELNFPYQFYKITKSPGAEEHEEKDTVGFFGYFHY